MSREEPVIVKLQSAALDDKDGQVVAHGWLDIDAIQNLRVGDYQRAKSWKLGVVKVFLGKSHRKRRASS